MSLRVLCLLPLALGVARAEAPVEPTPAPPVVATVAPPAPPTPPAPVTPAPVLAVPAPAEVQYECTSFPVRSTMAMGAFQAPADVSNARLNPTRLPVGWTPMAGSIGEGGAFVVACRPVGG
ncbi:MAG: hypothetical protein V4850_19285 [Myxococcota bacterium]